MNLVSAKPGLRGVDTIQRLSAKNCLDLKAAGVDFIERYLGSLTAQEIEYAFDAHLLIALVSYSRAPGWLPDPSKGTQDAQVACLQARNLGIPQGATLQCDLETPGGTYEDVIAYSQNEGKGILAGNFDPGLYVGDSAGLTSDELMALPHNRYCHSCSRIRDRFNKAAEPTRGWCQIQCYPPNLVIAGVQVDLSFCQTDYEGGNLILVGP